MLRRPPHVLIATPESLYILLTTERARAAFRSVRTVIVDELLALVDEKRGSFERQNAKLGLACQVWEGSDAHQQIVPRLAHRPPDSSADQPCIEGQAP